MIRAKKEGKVLGKEKIEINDMYFECFKNTTLGTEFTRKKIVSLMQNMFDVEEESILPSDVCYNSSNLEVEGNTKKKYFVKIGWGKYRYVGPDFDASNVNPYEYGTIEKDDININSNRKIIKAYDSTHSIEEQENQAVIMDIDSLRVAAEKHSNKKRIEKEVVVKQIHRDAYIAEYAKRRANGICQLCEKHAPFIDIKGNPYLESHHIIWLSNGGEDSVKNTVALCPNCHRKMHIINSEEDINKLLNKIDKL